MPNYEALPTYQSLLESRPLREEELHLFRREVAYDATHFPHAEPEDYDQVSAYYARRRKIAEALQSGPCPHPNIFLDWPRGTHVLCRVCGAMAPAPGHYRYA